VERAKRVEEGARPGLDLSEQVSLNQVKLVAEPLLQHERRRDAVLRANLLERSRMPQVEFGCEVYVVNVT
jgi:hypothetical protein